MAMKNDNPSTGIFLSVAVLCLIWALFINDYSQVEIQSPIKFATATATDEAPTPKKASKKQKVHVETDEEPQVEENEAAPVVDLPPADVKAYIKKYAALAVEEMRRTGVPASISLAQGIIESRAGKSGLAITANNHFGIKCSVHGKCPAGHCINFTDDSKVDYFIVYQNAWKSWKAHSDFLKQKRYSKCFQQSSYVGFAKCLKAAGYATDPGYATKIIATIRKYKLDQLDAN